MDELKISVINNKNYSNNGKSNRINEICNKKKAFQQIVEEMAFHEAAHFVISVLISEFSHKSQEPKRIDFKVQKGIKFNAKVVKNTPKNFALIPIHVSTELGF